MMKFFAVESTIIIASVCLTGSGECTKSEGYQRT